MLQQSLGRPVCSAICKSRIIHTLCVYSFCILVPVIGTMGTNAISNPDSFDNQFNISVFPSSIKRMAEGSSKTVYFSIPRPLQKWEIVEVESSDEQIAFAEIINIAKGASLVDGLKRKADVTKNFTSYGGQEVSSAPSHPDNSSLETILVKPEGRETSLLDFLTSHAERTVVIISVKGIRLGKAFLYLNMKNETDITLDNATTSINVHMPFSNKTVLLDNYEVIVVRTRRIIDTVYQYVLLVLLCTINFLFGCELDLKIVWGFIKKPIPPMIGFLSQYLVMPLLGLTLTQILRMDPIFSLGLIAISCSPGGGASNSWTILLRGDVNLSLTMTFLSLTLALGMMPLWMFVITKIYFSPGEILIPYTSILITLTEFILPCFLGVLTRKFLPKFGKKATKATKPMSLLFLLWVLIFGSYVNFYMWKLMVAYPVVIAAGILLPWCGFAFGFTMATLFRQPRAQAITIAIETGVQNIGIPIVMLMGSFPQPEGDIAATLSTAVGVFTPIPLYVALITLAIKRRCEKGKNNYVQTGNGDDGDLDRKSGEESGSQGNLPEAHEGELQKMARSSSSSPTFRTKTNQEPVTVE